MSTQLEGIDQWREYFRTANADIFEIIEKGILVAASDCPTDFKLRRDRIAEVLFSTRLNRCTQCDRVELSVPGFDEGGRGARVQSDGPGGSKESKANSIMDDLNDVNLNPMSNYSFGEAEALTDELDEQDLFFQEVLRIKEIFNNFENESDSVLFESLRRLQLMRLTFDVLRATEIGKTVNDLRKHGANHIRHLARELIAEWKTIVDDYMEKTQDTRDPAGSEKATPDSVNPSVVDDEEGLPSPPMDDCAFFTTQNIDFSQFFDGMDDDGNLENSGQLNKNQRSGRRPSGVKPDVSSQKDRPKEEVVLIKEEKVQPLRKSEYVPKPNNKPLTASGPGRPVKLNVEQIVNPTQTFQKKSDKPDIPRRPVIQSEKIRSSNDGNVHEKLEAAKRKLQERYKEAENAKRQRTIQVMELCDLPKQGLVKKNPHNKHSNGNRNWANGRR